MDSLLRSEPFARLLREHPRALLVTAVRRTLDRLRDELASGYRPSVPTEEELAGLTRREVEALRRPSPRRVINATGIPLHTNLGRAPLSEAVARAVAEIARGYSNLEFDLNAGGRGSRHDHGAEILCELTGAEGALVVNNNAAALVLTLNELAEGRGVIVSRGELVEIGGSFRVPEIIAKSGARIVEVGATNRTHPSDYRDAIGPETGVLLKVHRSNFTQAGFVREVDIDELVPIGQEHGVPVVHDIGSGLLFDLSRRLGLPHEPNVRDSLEAGADIVTFSGDKLLGGPQAGLVLGRRDLIDRMRRNPLLRALRVGKLTLAALTAALTAWRDEETVVEKTPALAMIAADPQRLLERARRLATELRAVASEAKIVVIEEVTQGGGGSYPGGELPAGVVQVVAADRSEGELESALRAGTPPVIARVREGAVLIDLRTVPESEEPELVEVVRAALGAVAGD